MPYPVAAVRGRPPQLSKKFVPSDVTQAEADALIALYDATDGDNWSNNTGWKSDPIVGNWYGVTVSGGNVTQVDLNNNSLSGSIPTEIGDLTSLILLYLYNNSLSGSIPTEIGDLTSLTQLVLHSNSLSGSIPTEFGNLTSLTFLRLDDNSLSGFGTNSMNLTAISDLRLQDNGFNQATVDDAVQKIYSYRASYTDATPALNIGGSNSAPSGTYQDGDPPTTGKEYIYELENDPEAEGFNTWAITYTA